MYRGKHNKSGAPASRRRLRRPLLAAAAVVLILGAAIGGTVAYLVTDQNAITNTFTPANVDVEIKETVQEHQKTSITIQNTGNIKAYIRVMLVGNTVETVDGKEVVTGSFEVAPSLETGWVKGNNGYYYYTQPVAAGKSTGNLLADGSSINLKSDQTVTVLAQAIQSVPTNVVTSVWKVTLDSNGQITGGAAG